MREVKDNVFKSEVIDSDVPVVVDFWAKWCGPCRMVAPVMEELDKQYKGKIKFVKINIDENPVASRQYGIISIPTMLVFKDGKAINKMVGFKPKAQFEQILNTYI